MNLSTFLYLILERDRHCWELSPIEVVACLEVWYCNMCLGNRSVLYFEDSSDSESFLDSSGVSDVESDISFDNGDITDVQHVGSGVVDPELINRNCCAVLEQQMHFAVGWPPYLRLMLRKLYCIAILGLAICGRDPRIILFLITDTWYAIQLRLLQVLEE